MRKEINKNLQRPVVNTKFLTTYGVHLYYRNGRGNILELSQFSLRLHSKSLRYRLLSSHTKEI